MVIRCGFYFDDIDIRKIALHYAGGVVIISPRRRSGFRNCPVTVMF